VLTAGVGMGKTWVGRAGWLQLAPTCDSNRATDELERSGSVCPRPSCRFKIKLASVSANVSSLISPALPIPGDGSFDTRVGSNTRGSLRACN
jgi:hypothetical protein